MKKILSVTGIIALVAIITFDAYAATPGTANPSNKTTQQGFMSADFTSTNAMEDDSYSEYGYRSRSNGGNHGGSSSRGGHQSSRSRSRHH